ncbi:MAG TPA: O-antigen ligase family protein [Chloroflexia bacterium]|nr:O-antigen ligase family protein [Chloroflexia bacterium]
MSSFSFENRLRLAATKQAWPFSLPQVVGVAGLVGLAALLLAQQPFVVIGLVIGVAAFVLVTRHPEWGLYLMVLSVPGQSDASIGLGGSRLTLTQATIFLALAGWIGSRVLYKLPFIPRPLPRLLPFYALYLFTMFLSLTVAQSTSESFNEIYRWAVTAFAYWLACSVVQTRRQIWILVFCLCAGPVFEGALGIYQSTHRLGPESYAINGSLSRAFGTFVMPNSYAGYLEMAIPLLAMLLLRLWLKRNEATRQWMRLEGKPRETERKTLLTTYLWLVVALAATGTVVLGNLLSFSRGGWLGLAVATLVLLLVNYRKTMPVLVIGGGLVLFLVLGLQTGAIPESTFGRITSAADDFRVFDVRDVKVNSANFAIVERMAMWQAGGNMFLSNPWLGVGIGNYNVRYPDFNTPFWPDSRGHAHNYYIQAAAETGLIGATAYMLLLLSGIFQGFSRAVRTRDSAWRFVIWGAFGVIIAVAMHNLVEDLHVLNMGIQWSSLLALFYIVDRFEQKEGTSLQIPAQI